MAKKTKGSSMLERAQASFVRQPVVNNSSPQRRNIPASRGVQELGNMGRATGVDWDKQMVRAPRSALDEASGLMTQRQTERLASRVRNAPRSSDTPVTPARTAMTRTAPRTALDGATGLMTPRQNARLAERVRRAVETQPSRPVSINVQAPELRALPAPKPANLPLPEVPTNAGTVAPTRTARTPRMPRGGRLGAALQAYALGVGMSTPVAVQREAEYRRNRARQPK